MIVWNVIETCMDYKDNARVFDAISFKSEQGAWNYFNNRIERNDGVVERKEIAEAGMVGFGYYNHDYYGDIFIEVTYSQLFP